jgi:hypothetical protein
MEPLITLYLEPNKRRQLPPLAYSGSLLLRWQIVLNTPGIDPLRLTAQIAAQQTIDPIGHIDRGEWTLPAGYRLDAPLAEIAYSPLIDWFITTPDGFKNSILALYPYTPPIYQISTDSNGDFIMNIASPNTPPTSNVSTDTVIAASTTSVVLLSPNAGRLEGMIINNTNRVAWIAFGGSAAAAFPAKAVPVGGNISIPENYVGSVTGICAGQSNNLTGVFQITEFIAS